jgi:carboxypeptidase C (cathepsin A)
VSTGFRESIESSVRTQAAVADDCRNRKTCLMIVLALRACAIASLFVLTGAGTASAESAPRAEATATKGETGQPALEESVNRRSSTSIRGKAVSYTATAGSLVIRDDRGLPIASVFYVGYTVNPNPGAAERPVTFLFNGGPGSSSVWLHLGSVGPLRVETPDVRPAGGGPFHLIANPDSILDKTDLVFIDAIGTGFSHAIGDAQDKDFWGIDEDIDSFARAIVRWTRINQRWNSPKFILGESYGGFRAAGLAATLQQRAFPLTGVILACPAVDLTLRNPNYDQFYASFLPSLAAVSWYHGHLTSRTTDLKAFLEEVRAYALGAYITALTKGNELPDAERHAVARQLSLYTGLSEDFIVRSNLRIDFRRFRKELLRGQGLTIGALDARYTGTDADTLGDVPEFDASEEAISGAYSVLLNEYLFKTLGYQSDRNYLLENGSIVQGGWNWIRKIPPAYYPWAAVPMTSDLSEAMRKNPRLRILTLLSYYDFASPFVETELELTHLQIDPSQRGNLTFAYYESGHMIYLDRASLHKMKDDLDSFLDSALRHSDPALKTSTLSQARQ